MFSRKSDPDSYTAPQRLDCITKGCKNTANHPPFCHDCDQKILAAVERTNQPLRTNVNHPPR